jgi:hypothetical protein
MAIYLGKRPHGDLILFECEGRPTHANTAGRFISTIGPFATRLGASYFVRYGQQAGISPADADRLAIEDPNPVWQMVREQLELEMRLSAKELAEWRQCEAEEYEPDKPTPGAIEVTDLLRQSLSIETLYQE